MIDTAMVTEHIIKQIKTVHDPEIPVDIFELGLIYRIEVSDDGLVDIDMTLTTPMCPVADSLPMEVQEKIMAVDGVKDVNLKVVFDPPWNKSMMSEEALFALDMF
ncbi:MAG TPA: iron-sulfur cluster assembly protein [Saprospiraceae bacterium]|nr:iron-sulfur cluster assembly protein [Saprospiraceae bacterium]